MAFVHGKNTNVFVGIAELTPYFKETSVSNEFDMAETSCYGQTYKTFIQGLGNSTISMSGLYDSTATIGPDVILSGLIPATVTTPVSFFPEGDSVGAFVYHIGAQLSNYEVTSSIGDVVAVSAQFQTVVNSGGKTGRCLLPATTAIAATGSQTGVANGASFAAATSTANGGFATLHAITNTWNNNTVYKVQHSADTTNGVDGVWTDLITFTTIPSTTRASEYIQVAAGTTVNKALRAQYTLTAGAGTINAALSFTRL